MEILAERIKELRKERGISQGKLAESIGVDPTFISQVENRKSSVSVDMLVLLAQYFEVSADYLLGLTD